MQDALNRIQRMQAQMQRSGESAVIVSGLTARFWVSGDVADDPLLLDRNGNLSRGLTEIHTALADLAPCRVGIDPEMTAPLLLKLQVPSTKPGTGIEWRPSRTIALCRAVKDAGEISMIRQAAAVTRSLLGELAEIILPGISEMEILNWLNIRVRELGADGLAFEPSIGSGKRGAAPWAGVTLRRLEEGEPVVIDCGAMLGGYRSDMTRTYVAGEFTAHPEIMRMQEAVLRTMDNVVKALRPGVPCRQLHRIAQESLHGFGWEMPMPHALGHGVGLELHERPYVSSTSTDVLEAGMVLAIEPGVYDDRMGGFRTEDMYVITAHGAQRIDNFNDPSQLREHPAGNTATRRDD